MSLVPLSDGGWAPLPTGWLERHGRRVAELLDAKRSQADGPLPTYALPALAQLCGDLGVPPPGDLKRLAPLILGFESIPEAERPSDLTAELRDYQRQGVNWLCFMRDARLGATLADDMGLGKTLQALCAIRGKTLVICPRSVLFNWKNEAARFRPGLRCEVYHGPKRSLDPDADITITTYAVLRLDQELLASRTWDAVVLDEAQMIKNPDSQVSQAAYRLSADFRLTLSGTPVENRLEELWSQIHFTNPGLLGGRQYFQDQYASPIADGRPDAAKALRTKIRPFLLRRVKSEVAKELPPRTDLILECDLNDDERAVYDAIRAATQKEVVERLRAGGSVLQALESLLRLRQAACHSALVPGQEATSSSKIVELLTALDQATAEGHKSLVFSQWTSFLDLIEPHLAQANIRALRLDGSTRDRQGVVDAFQAAAGPPVLLLSLKAGGTGLNLTAADHVFLMDLWWNPAVEDQAADRAHRIGQERPVFVYRLVAKDTVEERIVLLQQKKRGIADAALGDADQAGGLTRDDLLTLLA
jgi:SNF2 family DNA or RNA helicase